MTPKGKFATTTDVSPEKTLEEIKGVLKKYQAGKFAYYEDDARIVIGFEAKGRRVRFIMPLPTKDEGLVKVNASNATRYSETAHEQAIRARWRALLLTIRAKLESVEAGVELFEEAFMAQLVLPSGQTVGEWGIPQIAAAYESGAMPQLLPSGDLK